MHRPNVQPISNEKSNAVAIRIGISRDSGESNLKDTMFTEKNTAIASAIVGLRNRARVTNTYSLNAGTLLDGLIVHLELKNDAALARVLELAPPMISKLRHFTLPVSAAVLVRMHEVSGLSIRDLRLLMGDRRRRFGISD